MDVIGLSSNIIAIDAGAAHVCALTDSGAMRCWGRNQDGELGDGTTINRSIPVGVTGLSSGVIAMQAGGASDIEFRSHTCAITSGGRSQMLGAK